MPLAALYTSKFPLTAVHVLNNDVLPFFEAQGVRVETLLSDKRPGILWPAGSVRIIASRE